MATPPGPSRLNGLKALQRMRDDGVGFLLDQWRTYGDVSRFYVGPIPIHLVVSPDGARHVLQENARNYNKQTRGFAVVRELLGQGLLTSEGAFWLRQRRLMQPAFHRQRLSGFAGLMVDAAKALGEEWGRAAEAGKPLDITDGIMKLTLRVASESLFGTDLGPDAERIDAAFSTELVWAKKRLTELIWIPRSFPTPRNREAQAALGVLDEIVYRVIEKRRASGEHRDDLLAMLMEASDEETGEKMSDRQLRDEVMTLMLAGHETSANALSWTFALLSRHVAARNRLEAEVDEVLEGGDASLEQLPKLKYTRRVIDEALRLYPPAWSVSRCAEGDDAISGYQIPKGGIVLLVSYLTHRHPLFFENPEGFDPDRFTPEREKALPRFAYFPFGGGPRQCIGNSFALMEMTLVLAQLVSKFRVNLVPGYRFELDPSITLRPKNGIAATVERR